MNKKADFGVSINTIVVLILAITMLGLGLAFLRDVMKPPFFNPEKDVCIKFNICLAMTNHGNTSWKCDSGWIDSPIQDNKFIENHPYMFQCSQWRPKTICELNPNNESCVCDEYKYKENDSFSVTIRVPLNNEVNGVVVCDNTIVANNEKTLYGKYINDDCLLDIGKFAKYNVCIKAHEPTKCDKDPDAVGCICDTFATINENQSCTVSVVDWNYRFIDQQGVSHNSTQDVNVNGKTKIEQDDIYCKIDRAYYKTTFNYDISAEYHKLNDITCIKAHEATP